MMLRLYFAGTAILTLVLLVGNFAVAGWLGLHFHSVIWVVALILLGILGFSNRSIFHKRQVLILFAGLLSFCITGPLGLVSFLVQTKNPPLAIALTISTGAILIGALLGLVVAWLILQYFFRKQDAAAGRGELLHSSLAAVMLPFTLQPWLALVVVLYLALITLPHAPERPPRLERLEPDPHQVAAYRELVRYAASPENRELLRKQAKTDSLEAPTPGIQFPAPTVGYLQAFEPELNQAAKEYDAIAEEGRLHEGVSLDPEAAEALELFLNFLAVNSPTIPEPSYETAFPAEKLIHISIMVELGVITKELERDPEKARQRYLRLTRVLATQWRRSEVLVSLLINYSLTGKISQFANHMELDLHQQEKVELVNTLQSIHQSSQEVLAKSIRGEITTIDLVLEDLENEPEVILYLNTQEAPEDIWRWMGVLGGFRLLAAFHYDKELTRHVLEDYFLLYYEAAKLPQWKAKEKLQEIEARIDKEQAVVTDPGRIYLTENLLGRLMIGIVIPVYDVVFDRSHEVQALLLMQIFALRTDLEGELPEVPKDPTSQSGQPFQVFFQEESGKHVITLSKDSLVRDLEKRDMADYTWPLNPEASFEADSR